MKARAEAAAATRERILASALSLIFERSFDLATIEAIAERAGTTPRTVMRLFGSKQMLIAAALETLGELGMAPIVAGDVGALVAGMYDFYEPIGDAVVRWLADEQRLPAMASHLEIGRRHLRSWVAEAFAAELARRAGPEREELMNALVVAFDVYAWKLLRRDLGLEPAAAQAVIRRMVTALLKEESNGEHAVAELVGRRQSAAEPRNRARSS